MTGRDRELDDLEKLIGDMPDLVLGLEMAIAGYEDGAYDTFEATPLRRLCELVGDRAREIERRFMASRRQARPQGFDSRTEAISNPRSGGNGGGKGALTTENTPYADCS